MRGESKGVKGQARTGGRCGSGAVASCWAPAQLPTDSRLPLWSSAATQHIHTALLWILRTHRQQAVLVDLAESVLHHALHPPVLRLDLQWQQIAGKQGGRGVNGSVRKRAGA